MPASTPITQRDVAQACGLHPSTVCLALKNSPSIPAATRRRIQAVAERLGYQPNVAARNLALMRNERRAGACLPIAWINQEARRDHWRADPEARAYLEGARRHAEESGYHLEEIWTREPGMSAGRVVQILRARGIEGVIFPAHGSFDFSLLHSGWSDFSMVGFNDHRLGEWIDVVCPDYFHNTATALRGLRARGFERIGLVLTPQFDAATNGLVHACYLRHQCEAPADERIPACLVPGAARAAADELAEWLDEHRPEAVLCRERGLAEQAHRRGAEPVWVQVQGSAAGCNAAIDPGAGEIAAAAIDCVIAKMRRFERGVREPTRLHLIKGTWQARALATREAETVVA